MKDGKLFGKKFKRDSNKKLSELSKIKTLEDAKEEKNLNFQRKIIICNFFLCLFYFEKIKKILKQFLEISQKAFQIAFINTVFVALKIGCSAD